MSPAVISYGNNYGIRNKITYCRKILDHAKDVIQQTRRHGEKAMSLKPMAISESFYLSYNMRFYLTWAHLPDKPK